jgi:hypothetical protein
MYRYDTANQLCTVIQALFTSHPNPKYFLFYPSHQIFRRMYGALNVGKKDNYLHSLSVNIGTNLLSLVSQ